MVAKENPNYLVDPDGKIVTVPTSEINYWLSEGYRSATTDDIAVHNYVDENKGLAGTAKVALGQFVDELAMGVPETALDYAQTDLEKAKREALKKDHEIANTIGGVAGFAGSMAYAGPALKALGIGAKATGAVGKMIANQLGNAAIDAGVNVAERTLSKVGTGVAGNIAKAGLEGAAFSAPRAATEAYFGDWEQAAETMAIGTGLGLAVGGGIEGLKGVAKSGSKTVKWVSDKLGIKSGENELAKSVASQEARESGDSLIEEAIRTKPKKDADRIKEILNRYNIDPKNWMFTENMVEKGQMSSLGQAPSVFGKLAKKELDDVYSKATQEVETLLSPKTERTLKESGDEAQKLLSAELLEKQMDFNMRYGWIDENLGNLPVSQDLKQYAVDRLASSDNVRLGLSREPLEIAKSVDAIQNFNDAKLVRTATRQKSSALTNNLDKAALNEAYGILTDLRAKAVNKLDANIPAIAEAQKIVKETDALYKQTLDKFKPIDEALGGRPSKNISDVLDKITDSVESSKMVGKLFNVSEISRLRQIKESFPEVFEVLKTQKMADIYSKSMTGLDLNVKKFTKQMDTLSPEIKEMMFGKGFKQKIDDIKTLVYEVLPEKIGPSGTPQGLDFLNILSVGLQLRDFTRYMLLKTGQMNRLNSALPLVEKSLKNTAKKLDQLDTILKGGEVKRALPVRQTITSGLSRLLYDHEDNDDHKDNFQKLGDRLTELTQNPEVNEATTAFATSLARNGAPNISDIYQLQIQKALNYLYEMLPKNPNPPSIFRQPWHPNDAQMAKFNRIIKTVDDPFSVISDLQENKLTLEQVDALQVVYPKVYDQIKNRVIANITAGDMTKLPYNKKIQLGILLNTRDIDNSMKNVMAYQNNFATPEAHINNLGQNTEQPKQTKINKNVKFTTAKNTGSELNRIQYRS